MGTVVNKETGLYVTNAGAGKDTLAGMMVEADGKWLTYPLAAPIKRIVNNIFNWDYNTADAAKEIEVTVKLDCDWYIVAAQQLNQLASYASDEIPADEFLAHFCDVFGLVTDSTSLVISPRKAYQLFGTEFGRAIDNNIWLKMIPTSLEYLIITDVRFQNEVDYLEQIGADLLTVKSQTSAPSTATGHSSEVETENSSLVVENFGTLDDLKLKAEALVEFFELSLVGQGADIDDTLDVMHVSQDDVVGDY